jgi:hypothetical protein
MVVGSKNAQQKQDSCYGGGNDIERKHRRFDDDNAPATREVASECRILFSMLATLLSYALPNRILVPDLHGKPVQVLPSPAKRGVVTFFALSGCPNANAYAPEMNRIAKAYGPKGWQFYLVYVDSFFSPQELIRNAEQFGYTFPVLHDTSELANKAQATKSPEAAVFSPNGDLLYHGRIDDRFYALGKQRVTIRVHDLRATLDAIDAGKPVPNKRTEVVGCFIPKD